MDYDRYLKAIHPCVVSHDNVIDAIKYCYGTADGLSVSRDIDSAQRICDRLAPADDAYVSAFISVLDDDMSADDFWYTLYWYVNCAIYSLEKDDSIATEDEKDELFEAFSTVAYKAHIEAMSEAVRILQDLVYKL